METQVSNVFGNDVTMVSHYYKLRNCSDHVRKAAFTANMVTYIKKQGVNPVMTVGKFKFYRVSDLDKVWGYYKNRVKEKASKVKKVQVAKKTNKRDGVRFLTRVEVEKRLGVGYNTFTKILESGKIPYFKVGNRYKFLWEDVVEALRCK